MNLSFNPWLYGQTVLNPLGIIALIVLGTAMLIVPRRNAIIPMIITSCFIAEGQRIVLFTLNFPLERIMIIFGTVRILAMGEWQNFTWKRMDSLLVGYALVSSAVFIAQYGTIDALKNQAGDLYDVLGMYFLFRCLIRDINDVGALARAFAMISVPLACAFMVERVTRRNMFAVFGGVPEITMVREGKLRCQGAFVHPIIAGCYWASLLPLIGALWWRFMRGWAVIGVACSLLIIFLCQSSTPDSGVIFAVIGALFFVLRRRMRIVRWTTWIGLLVLHLVMKAPVWHLVSDVDLVGGSTGYDRFLLIDAFIKHFSNWWMLGAKDVASWGVVLGDVTNQYALEGVRGGIWGLALFMSLIVVGFANCGRLWRQNERNVPNLAMSWALGVSLFVHVMSFIGISYFGQASVLWYLTLAIVASLSPVPRRAILTASAASSNFARYIPKREVAFRRVVASDSNWMD